MSVVKYDSRAHSLAIGAAHGGRGIYLRCLRRVCNKILEAMPTAFAGWEAMTNEQLLESLKSSLATVDAVRAVLHNQVEVLRKRKVSWAAIGDALGISRQAAWERFS